MPNFVLVYKGGAMGQTEAERQQIMVAWGQWFGALGQSIVDGGNPFSNSSTVDSNGSVKNGASSQLTGYSILKADDLSAASTMAKGCPVLTTGGTIEVYETFPVM